MIEHVLTSLNRPETWLLLLFDVLIALGVWRIGMNLLQLNMLHARLPARVATPVRALWSLLVAYALAAVLINHVRADGLEPLYTHGGLINRWFRETAGQTVAVIVLAVVAWSLVTAAATRIVPSDEFTRASVRVQTLKGVVESTLRAAIVIIVFVTVLDNVGVRTSTLLAGVSVIGLAVSFGAQSLIKDVINGFFILLEDQYGVGDVITVNAGTLSGGVERMNLRFTALRALDGTLHIIPNGQINTVSVMSKDWSRVVATIGFPPTADVNEALDVLTRVAGQLYADSNWSGMFLEPPQIDGVTNLTKDGFELRALFKVLPKEQWPVGREFNRRMKIALDEIGLGGLRPQLMVVRTEGGADTAVPLTGKDASPPIDKPDDKPDKDKPAGS